MRNGLGVLALRKHYGGKQRRGTKTEHKRNSAGKCIRYCLQQLAAAKIVDERRFFNDEEQSIILGKALTSKGRTDMDRIAAQLIKENRK
jgi:small subunit ribosomal protein S19e